MTVLVAGVMNSCVACGQEIGYGMVLRSTGLAGDEPGLYHPACWSALRIELPPPKPKAPEPPAAEVVYQPPVRVPLWTRRKEKSVWYRVFSAQDQRKEVDTSEFRVLEPGASAFLDCSVCGHEGCNCYGQHRLRGRQLGPPIGWVA